MTKKKIMSKCSITVITLMMLLSIFSMQPFQVQAESQSDKNQNEVLSSNLDQDNDDDYKAQDSIRIVVELKGKSGVMKANEANISFSDLGLNERNNLHQQLLTEQTTVKNQLDSQDFSIEYIDEYTAIFNGFSAKVLYENVEKIKDLDNVQDVYISEVYERPVTIEKKGLNSEEEIESGTANDIVNAPLVWEDLGYDGSGMTVAVLDDGIDVEHRDIVLSDSTDAALNETSVEQIVEEQELLGGFYTDKVPYGYNYADKNDNIKDEGEGASNHGMHVSGITGANGDLDNEGIKGVAPEVQILGMKVFSNDQESGTSSDIYVKAIDDAVKLDADAINMSFGSTSKVPNPDDPAQIAIERATENGTMVMKSAGNGYRFGRDEDKLFTANPDLSVSSSPQIPKGSTAVANFENSHLDYPGFSVSVDGKEADIVAYRPSSKAPSPDSEIDEENREIVFAGYGRTPGDDDDDPDADDFDGLDLEGKIALVKRGNTKYKVKAANAEDHGAEAIIVFNNEDNGKYSNMSTEPDIKIPQVFILKGDGEEIVDQLEKQNQVKIAFRDDRVDTENPRAGKLASSSAWGPPNLDLFIPAITGVGSQILSTLNDDTYGVKSGGSMSAPQVAGGSTLLKSKLEEESDFDGIDLTMMTKNILMNTATPMENVSETSGEFGIEKVPYTPRRQGGGLMDLYAALKTPVVVSSSDNNIGGATVGEVGESFTFTLDAVNFSDEDVAYDVDANVQTDLAEGKYHYLESVGVINENDDSLVSFHSDNGKQDGNDYQITIPANEKVQLDVTVDLSEAVDEYTKQSMDEMFKNGRFIEGFVELTDSRDENPELTLPYVSFYGDWNEPPVLDPFIDNEEDSFYGEAGMVTDNSDDDDFSYLGVDPVDDTNTNHFAISPNNEEYNNIMPALSFLRNARKAEFNITDEEGSELTSLYSKSRIRKHYKSSDAYTVFDKAKWDGTIDGETVDDGLYYYMIKTRINDDADWQERKIPVYVDTKKPKLTAGFVPETNTVEWDAEDEGSGVASIEIIADGDSISEKIDPEKTSYTIEEDLGDIDQIEVIATDWAGNENTADVVDDSNVNAERIMDITDELEEKDAVQQEAAHTINMHLAAVEQFEKKDQQEKVLKHMETFKILLEKEKEQELITKDAHNKLVNESDILIKKWEK